MLSRRPNIDRFVYGDPAELETAEAVPLDDSGVLLAGWQCDLSQLTFVRSTDPRKSITLFSVEGKFQYAEGRGWYATVTRESTAKLD
jgi:hypothetical protein